MQEINKTLKVILPSKEQEIEVGQNILSAEVDKLCSSDYSNFVIFCDSNFAEIHNSILGEFNEKLKPADVIMVDPNEDSKSLTFLNDILEKCTNLNLDRRTCFIALGGGVVGDVTGFIASVYMRGVDMIFFPTTLMAQGDSIINKVAISYKLLKNVIGSFYSPNKTICDTALLNTLSEKEISLGLSEVIKHALIASRGFTTYLIDSIQPHLIGLKAYDWDKIIYESIKIKSDLVEQDPYDKNGLHKGLSYGHTFANAFEGMSEFNLRHGEAVALGMRVSGIISNTLGFLDNKDFRVQQQLLDRAQLPSVFPNKFSIDRVIDYLKRDKISSNGNIKLVLLKKIGEFDVVKGIDENIINEALSKIQP